MQMAFRSAPVGAFCSTFGDTLILLQHLFSQVSM